MTRPPAIPLSTALHPARRWADLILPAATLEVLQQFTTVITHRGALHRARDFGAHRLSKKGLTALFAGPSGTGKTLAAEVIATESGRALYRIDLAAVVSKYVGETEKNLERVFTAADHQDVILLFDEVDALFGKRSEVKDAHDRYANLEVGYLLQRLESYDGIAILATNQRRNLDEAFLRRLHVVIDFPLPGTAERLHLWQRVLTRSGANSLEAASLDALAEHHPLSGGEIQKAALRAMYLAAARQAQVTLQDLHDAIEATKVARTPASPRGT